MLLCLGQRLLQTTRYTHTKASSRCEQERSHTFWCHVTSITLCHCHNTSHFTQSTSALSHLHVSKAVQVQVRISAIALFYIRLICCCFVVVLVVSIAVLTFVCSCCCGGGGRRASEAFLHFQLFAVLSLLLLLVVLWTWTSHKRCFFLFPSLTFHRNNLQVASKIACIQPRNRQAVAVTS